MVLLGAPFSTPPLISLPLGYDQTAATWSRSQTDRESAHSRHLSVTDGAAALTIECASFAAGLQSDRSLLGIITFLELQPHPSLCQHNDSVSQLLLTSAAASTRGPARPRAIVTDPADIAARCWLGLGRAATARRPTSASRPATIWPPLGLDRAALHCL